MATELENVERIDILEGPNLDSLLHALKLAAPRGDNFMGISARFESVIFFGEDDKVLTELGKTFFPVVVGISYLANEASQMNRNDFVITVKSMATFKGLYNTHYRKGSLSIVR